MMYGILFTALFLGLLAPESAHAQLSIAAHCARACEQQNPNIDSAAYRQCLAVHCSEFFESEQSEPVQSNPAPPPASVSALGA